MKLQEEFKNVTIDNIWNIVPLCPVHHKELHYIDEKYLPQKIEKLLSEYLKFNNKKFSEVYNEIFSYNYNEQKIINYLKKVYLN